jgi:hypothetical protein
VTSNAGSARCCAARLTDCCSRRYPVFAPNKPEALPAAFNSMALVRIRLLRWCRRNTVIARTDATADKSGVERLRGRCPAALLSNGRSLRRCGKLVAICSDKHSVFRANQTGATGVPRAFEDGAGDHSTRIGPRYRPMSASAVSRTTPSTRACAISMRSNGSLWMGSRSTTAAACRPARVLSF